MSYNDDLQSNNTDLEDILRTVQNLPSGGGGSSMVTTFTELCNIPTTGSGATELIDTGVTYAEMKKHKKLWICYKGASNTSLSNVYGGFKLSDGLNGACRFIRANGASNIVCVEIHDDCFITTWYMQGNPSIFPGPNEDATGYYSANNLSAYSGMYGRFDKRTFPNVADTDTFQWLFPESTVVYNAIIYAFD